MFVYVNLIECNMILFFFFFKQKTAYDIMPSLVGSEMCIRDSKLPIVIGMEGFNGYARPLDQLIGQKGYPLLNINNLKLARFKELFSGPAKTDAIDARKIVELMRWA